MKTFICILLGAIIATAFWSFKTTSIHTLFGNTTYPPEKYEVLSEGVTQEGDLKLTVRIASESLYYCPRALVGIKEGNFTYTLVRSTIEDPPNIDIPAQKNSDGSLSFTFPSADLYHKGSPIRLIDSNGTHHGSWTLHPTTRDNMPESHLSKLLSAIAGETVFGRDIDSKIRQASNEMSALALIELFKQSDTNAENWHKTFADEAVSLCTGDPSILIGFDDGRADSNDEKNLEIDLPDTEHEVYLKLKFRNVKACYYQFHLFPSFDEPFIKSCSRKRAEAYQYLCLTLTAPENLQIFIQNLRSTPHLEEVLDSNAEEFHAAPSQSM